MGNYVFTTEALVDIVTRRRADEDSKHDIGGNIIPALVDRGEAHVYDFSSNEVPGATERDRSYWRDVGTLDAYYDAHMDIISVDPIFNLYNSEWPILTWLEALPPAKFVFEEPDRVGHALNSLICAGVIVSGGDRPPLGGVAAACAWSRAASSRARSCCTASRSARARSCATRSSTRTSASRRARRSASTPSATASASPSRPAASS